MNYLSIVIFIFIAVLLSSFEGGISAECGFPYKKRKSSGNGELMQKCLVCELYVFTKVRHHVCDKDLATSLCEGWSYKCVCAPKHECEYFNFDDFYIRRDLKRYNWNGEWIKSYKAHKQLAKESIAEGLKN